MRSGIRTTYYNIIYFFAFRHFLLWCCRLFFRRRHHCNWASSLVECGLALGSVSSWSSGTYLTFVIYDGANDQRCELFRFLGPPHFVPPFLDRIISVANVIYQNGVIPGDALGYLTILFRGSHNPRFYLVFLAGNLSLPTIGNPMPLQWLERNFNFESAFGSWYADVLKFQVLFRHVNLFAGREAPGDLQPQARLLFLQDS